MAKQYKVLVLGKSYISGVSSNPTPVTFTSKLIVYNQFNIINYLTSCSFQSESGWQMPGWLKKHIVQTVVSN